MPASTLNRPATIRAAAATFGATFTESGLVTNEYAHRHPADPARRVSRDWIVTSGSLFSQGGAGWTGVPDRTTPNATSSNATDSAVFRLVSRRRNFLNVRVTFDLLIQRHVVSVQSGPHSYDGVHLWLRYASPAELYTMSVMRWDGTAVIKRKTQGGPSNGGSYRTLSAARSVIRIDRWVPVEVEAINQNTGVELSITIAGKPVLHGIDPYPGALTQPGAVGIRGDNTEFKFRDFRATPVRN